MRWGDSRLRQDYRRDWGAFSIQHLGFGRLTLLSMFISHDVLHYRLKRFTWKDCILRNCDTPPSLTIRPCKVTCPLVFQAFFFSGYVMRYCWWKKSCSTWDVWNPVNNGINYVSTGAGFLPSKVVYFGASFSPPRQSRDAIVASSTPPRMRQLGKSQR